MELRAFPPYYHSAVEYDIFRKHTLYCKFKFHFSFSFSFYVTKLTEGHALCSNCGQLLSFPPGSALVQCPICKTALSLRPLCKITLATFFIELDSTATGGQTRCSGCNQTMLFPLGATAVQCTNCSSITHCPPLQYYYCRGCGLYLAYCVSEETKSVLCTICYTLQDIVSIDMEKYSLQYGERRTRVIHQLSPPDVTSFEYPVSDGMPSSVITSEVTTISQLSIHTDEEQQAETNTEVIQGHSSTDDENMRNNSSNVIKDTSKNNFPPITQS
eukprot:jgi/Galph1/3896/GphlegSOOS_G2528.1